MLSPREYLNTYVIRDYKNFFALFWMSFRRMSDSTSQFCVMQCLCTIGKGGLKNWKERRGLDRAINLEMNDIILYSR